MKFLIVIALFCVSLVNANSLVETPFNEKEKDKKTTKENKDSDNLASRNFHSIQNWKLTIEYSNGDTVSKNIEINHNTSSSAMERAFTEAEKYIKTLKKVKNYNVSPVSNNPFVLLAGGK